MKFGYARVSTVDQNLDLQRDALAAAGADRIFEDTSSGAKGNRPGLNDLLSHVRNGDVVIVWRLDRLFRSHLELLKLSADLNERGVDLISVTEAVNTTTATGKLLYGMLATLAEFERNLIIERTNAGLAAARSRGRVGGRRPVLVGERADAARALLAKHPRPSLVAIGKALGVGATTVKRFIDAEGL